MSWSAYNCEDYSSKLNAFSQYEWCDDSTNHTNKLKIIEIQTKKQFKINVCEFEDWMVFVNQQTTI